MAAAVYFERKQAINSAVKHHWQNSPDIAVTIGVPYIDIVLMELAKGDSSK
jgi:hypothetical protein